jgi:hypothetical protein
MFFFFFYDLLYNISHNSPLSLLHQAFRDSRCKYVMIASKLCSSSQDNTAYIGVQFSKDIKAGVLPEKYHVVLDKAYPCTEQEMSPWKGRNLPPEKDAFNNYLSLNWQVIE